MSRRRATTSPPLVAWLIALLAAAVALYLLVITELVQMALYFALTIAMAAVIPLVVLIPLGVYVNWRRRRSGRPPLSRWGFIGTAVMVGLTLSNFFAYIGVGMIPYHRRIMRYWMPTRLPPLPRSRGFTLIELLIVIAIVAALVPPAVFVSQGVHRAGERQARQAEAHRLIEDTVAWLRAQPELSAPGEHALAPPLAEMHPGLAPHARIAIEPGPRDDLRRVEVRVALFDDLHNREIRMGALLRARRAAVEAEP